MRVSARLRIVVGLLVCSGFLPVPALYAGPAPDPNAIARLDSILDRRSSVRVKTDFATLTVTKPSADPLGLSFRHSPGYPPSRPAFITLGSWDTIASPPNPIPWSRIERIEEHRSVASYGAVLGAVAGVALAALLWEVPDLQGKASWPVKLGFAGFLVGSGGVAGFAIGSLGNHWAAIYPP